LKTSYQRIVPHKPEQSKKTAEWSAVGGSDQGSEPKQTYWSYSPTKINQPHAIFN
jgi:hypothetical protein